MAAQTAGKTEIIAGKIGQTNGKAGQVAALPPGLAGNQLNLLCTSSIKDKFE